MTSSRWPTFMKLCLAAGTLLAAVPSIRADEGMWLFNVPPKSQLKEHHNFEPSQEWLYHLMRSSVRFNSGGSGSFVSSNGLVLTNHHVAADTLYKLSTAEHNYNENGFTAKSEGDEIKAPDMELNTLVSIEDVTERVNGAVKPEMAPDEAAKARLAMMGTIEKESLDATGFRSDVVTLFGGARYHLYRYKKYTDVRLVWAPESAIAFFGGDADNFEYPRYCLDVTLFRVYEDGKPAKIEHFLAPDPAGGKDGDLVFVSGHPGRTRRIFTSDAIQFQRDVSMPRTMNLLRRKEVLLQQFGFRGPEEKRIAKDDLMGVQNSRKAISGMLAGLQDPQFFASKLKDETALQGKVKGDPKLQHLAGAWGEIKRVQDQRREGIARSGTFRSEIYSIAETIVLMVAEDEKPSGERLRPYRESNRESLLQDLYSDAPLYPEFERTQLADELARFAEDRGGSHELVVALFDGKGPSDRATDLIAGTKLFSVEERRKLVESGIAGVRASNDPLIRLALTLEPEYRAIQKINEGIDESERQAYTKITEAKFATEGENLYPDATFTLRLSYGTVKGYESKGERIPSSTTLGGAYPHEQKHLAEDPWTLPKSWKDAKGKFDESQPFNFVCTADIIGGNSGSPVVSREGKLVGVIFDGNIESLTSDLYYSDRVARAVSVHIAGVLETMVKIYNAKHIVEQIGK